MGVVAPSSWTVDGDSETSRSVAALALGQTPGAEGGGKAGGGIAGGEPGDGGEVGGGEHQQDSFFR